MNGKKVKVWKEANVGYFNSSYYPDIHLRTRISQWYSAGLRAG
jgi:hypothetical protein